MSSNDTRRLYPVLAMMIGASLWGVIWYPLRLLEAGGFAGVWLTLTLYATAFLASLPFTWRALPECARHPWLLLLLMLAAGWTNIAFVEAVLQGNILRVLLPAGAQPRDAGLRLLADLEPASRGAWYGLIGLRRPDGGF